MLVLDDTCVWRFAISEVHDRHALIVFTTQTLVLEPKTAVLELAEAITEVGIDSSSVHDEISHSIERRLVLQIVNGNAYVGTRNHLLNNTSVTTFRNALKRIVKVIVIVDKAQWYAPHDRRRQLRAGLAPLLFGVTLYQLFVNVTPGKG